LRGCAALRRAGGGGIASPALRFSGEGPRGAGAPGGSTPAMELAPVAGGAPSRDDEGDRKPTSVTGASVEFDAAGVKALDASRPVRPRMRASKSTALRCCWEAAEAIAWALIRRWQCPSLLDQPSRGAGDRSALWRADWRSCKALGLPVWINSCQRVLLALFPLKL